MNKFLPSAILFIAFSLILTSTSAQLTDKNYRIYSVAQAKEVDLKEIVMDMENYDVLFYGEQHNDSVTHFIEKKLAELLFQEYQDRFALSMEMFDRDVQGIMNEYLDGLIREKNLKKDARVWSNYNDYKPMVEFAKEHHMDVICANAAGRYSNLAGRNGMQGLFDLPEESKQNFAPLPFDTAIGKYHDKIIALTTHDASPVKSDSSKPVSTPPVSPMGNFNFVMGQSLWDATMAYSIAQYLKRNRGMKIMQVNGRVHSDEGFGIVPQLITYKHNVRTCVISTFPDEITDKTDWTKFEGLADYIIITDIKVPTTYE